MKAIVLQRFGSPNDLVMTDIAPPTIGAHDILVNVRATSLNKGDVVFVTGTPFLARPMIGNFFKPRPNAVVGGDFAGEIVEVGANVTKWRVGDAVMGDLTKFGWGGFGEYVAVPEDGVLAKPNALTFAEAAALPLAGVTAWQALRPVKERHRVLINGASGGVGLLAVQIAKARGAHVTAVCSTRHQALVTSLGADVVIDYTRESFVNSNARYDVIHAANGHQSIFTYRKLLTNNGTYAMSGGSMRQMMEAMVVGPLLTKKGGQTLGNVMHKPNLPDLAALVATDIRPVVSATYALEETKEAFVALMAGAYSGKIVVVQ